MASPLESAIDFLKDFGFFNVVLPFLLTFTLVFAILEKTKILGTEEVEGQHVAKRNLNAMFAFVVALLVVATPPIVGVITQSLPQITLLLLVIISFMLLIGTLAGSDEFKFKGKTLIGFGIAMVVGVLLIFLGAIRTESDESLLTAIIDWIGAEWGGTVFAAIILLIIITLAIWVVVGGGKKKEGK